MSEPISDFEISQKVEQFADAIMTRIREYSPEMEIMSNADTATSDDGDRSAQRIYIKTDFGVVVVMPDFVKRSSAACAIDIGMVRWMSMEGFTDEQIDSEGKIYSKVIEFTPSSTDVLAYYLTHKVVTRK